MTSKRLLTLAPALATALATVLATTTALMMSVAAQAQSTESALQRADSRLDRTDMPEPHVATRTRGWEALTTTSDKPQPFTLSLTLPFTYATNVENAATGLREAAHFTPELTLAWQQPDGTLRPFASVTVDSDFYTRYADNDGSTLSGRIGVKLYKPDVFGKFVPYVHYAPLLVYEHGFTNHQVTAHDLAIGVAGKLALGKSNVLISAQAARRLASLSSFEMNRMTVFADFTGPINQHLDWKFTQTVKGKFYTGGTNDGRRDVVFTTNAGLSFAIGGEHTLDFGIQFERNSSNRAGKSYSGWDIGPSLGLGWKF